MESRAVSLDPWPPNLAIVCLSEHLVIWKAVEEAVTSHPGHGPPVMVIFVASVVSCGTRPLGRSHTHSLE